MTMTTIKNIAELATALAPAFEGRISLSVDELAAASGIGRTKIFSDIKTRRLRVCKVGRRTVVLAIDAMAWLRGETAGEKAA